MIDVRDRYCFESIVWILLRSGRHGTTIFSHFLKFDPYSRKPKSFISYIQRNLIAIHNSCLDLLCRKGACVHTVGHTILMWVWFSHEVGTIFRKREYGGERHYLGLDKRAISTIPQPYTHQFLYHGFLPITRTFDGFQ